MAYGWNATAYQILNPGIQHWFSDRVPAVAGYVRRGNFLLVAGAPVCPEAALAKVAEELEEFADQQGCRVCYVCAADRLANLFASSTEHSLVTIGAQPVWDPRGWAGIVASSRSLRAQINRAANKGLRVEAVRAEEARQNSAFRELLAKWLHTRNMPPMHFLVEPETLEGELRDRVIFRAENSNGMAGFLVASPVKARNGYLIEQVVRSPEAPNGTSELLIDRAMALFASENRTYVTLGLVALSSHAEEGVLKNPWWLRTAMLLARTHANRFYNFQGLENFRTKMKPDQWEKIYAISNEKYFSVRALYALGAAFAGISPWQAVALAVTQAARAELKKI